MEGLMLILLVVFVTLKLSGSVDWSWWIVLSPVWIPMGIALAVIGVMYLIAEVVYLIGLVLDARNN